MATAVRVVYGGKTTEVPEGKTATFKLANKKATSDFVIYYETVGSYTYNGITTTGRDGKHTTIRCEGLKFTENIVVYGGEPKGTDSPFPIEIATEELMNDLLINATDSSVGGIYKYMGSALSKYEYGQLYIISKEG